jgi:hypothetical protein
MSNGVLNLVPNKERAIAEIALLALRSDIRSGAVFRQLVPEKETAMIFRPYYQLEMQAGA